MLNILMKKCQCYDLIGFSDNYSKTSGILFQYCRDVPAVVNNVGTIDFTEASVTDSFNLKVKLTGQAGEYSKNCWNSGTIKICKYVLETSCNVFN